MQILKLDHGTAQDSLGQPARRSRDEQPFRFLVGNAPDHRLLL